MNSPTAKWMKLILRCAAVFHLLWGIWLILFPVHMLHAFPSVWAESPIRLGGMIIFLWGIGFGLASVNPAQHWVVILTGFAGKFIMPIFLLWELRLVKDVPFSSVLILFLNNVVWWVPLGFLLYKIYQQAVRQKRVVCPDVRKLALRVRTSSGVSVATLSVASPVMLIFLRTAGCSCFRRALQDLEENRESIEESGVKIVLVHMDPEPLILPHLKKFHLLDLDRVHDTRKSVYRAFGLKRAGLVSAIVPIFSWYTLKNRVLRCLDATGDWFQMPGVFLVFHGEVIRSYVHQFPTDRPDYTQLASGDTYPQTGAVV